MLNFWIASFLAMTRSDDKGVVLWRCRRLRVRARDEGLGCEYRVKRFPFGEIARLATLNAEHFDGVNGVEC